MAQEPEPTKARGITMREAVILGVVGVLAIWIGLWVFDHLIGIVWFAVQAVILVVVVGVILALVLRWRR
jgi:hypothetical protein